MEQELAVIRLTIILHDAKETVLDERRFLDERHALEAELKTKEEQLQLYYSTVADYERRVEFNKAIQEQDKEIRRMFNDVPNKNQLLNFVRGPRQEAGRCHPRGRGLPARGRTDGSCGCRRPLLSLRPRKSQRNP